MCYNSFTMIHKGCYEIKYLYTYYIINIWCIIFNNNNICSLVKYLCPTRVVNNDEILNVCLHDLIFPPNYLQTLSVHLIQTQIWQSLPFNIWWIHQMCLTTCLHVFENMFTRVWRYVYTCLKLVHRSSLKQIWRKYLTV